MQDMIAVKVITHIGDYHDTSVTYVLPSNVDRIIDNYQRRADESRVSMRVTREPERVTIRIED